MPDAPPTSPTQVSDPSNASEGTFVPSSDAGEVTAKLPTGATVEIITPGSPTPSSSPGGRPRAGGLDPRERLPPATREMITGRATEGDGGGHVMLDKERVDRAANSMQRHGEGRSLPPSQDAERSLEK